ncbi:uncharacterized protein LOC114935339 [Nylanderia fulva]|uniref:uncharacterized protein LOC114935339 n=1 Tax=Nylanderia fulva TaxID=613905 RepID=UPI0010FB59B7|nr:uncharacterized protein LOC114935339 [Nylanderia fulva]
MDIIGRNTHVKKMLDSITNLENFITYSFFIDEIKYLCAPPLTIGSDLTERYCITHILYYIRQERARKGIFCRNQILLEWRATMAAQYLQPEKDVSYSRIKESLDSITAEVLNYLRDFYPDHAIFSTSNEILSSWRENHVDDNYWNELEANQIRSILNEFMFDVLNFRLCNPYNTDFENMCIDYVLKYRYGQQIILLIIYQSLARRLGLRCDVVVLHDSTQSCYCMFWKPTYAVNNLQNATCFKIGFNKFPDCFVDQTSLFIQTYPSFEYVTSMIRNVETGIFNALVQDTSSILYCSEMITLVNRWSIPGIHDYFSVQFECKESNQLNTRVGLIKFAIGMIVAHDDCIGVIVGWYKQYGLVRCKRYSTHGIQTEMCNTACRLYELPLKHYRNIKFEKQQTNYIILTEINKMCHVEEDAIISTTPRLINNSEIGRYFRKFEGMHYVPNQMLEECYPHDAAVTNCNSYLSLAIKRPKIEVQF